MRYTETIFDHKESKYQSKWYEIVVNVEFSEGDLIELQKILKKSNNTWARGLLNNIESSFLHKDTLNISK